MCSGNRYSPKIKEDLIPVLFWLARAEKKPMTKVVDHILRDELHLRGLKPATKEDHVIDHGRQEKVNPSTAIKY
jgi:hypothetical protein